MKWEDLGQRVCLLSILSWLLQGDDTTIDNIIDSSGTLLDK